MTDKNLFRCTDVRLSSYSDLLGGQLQAGNRIRHSSQRLAMVSVPPDDNAEETFYSSLLLLRIVSSVFVRSPVRKLAAFLIGDRLVMVIAFG